MPVLHRSPLRGALLAAIAVLAWGGPARAGSKNAVAALGQPAPGGGIFAGPSFTGWPVAAGTGWVAFRSTIFGGSTSEAIVAAHMTAPVTRVQVAAVGDAAPPTAAGAATGKFREFLGRPAINANGDVAFVALLTPPTKTTDPNAPEPAGVFLYRRTPPPDQPALLTIALSGTATNPGLLDLASPVDPNVDAGAVDVQERAPALNDAGDVAFLSAIRAGAQTAGAIFLEPAAGTLHAVVRIGDPFDGETFASLGPPALNRSGVLAFHALLDGAMADAAKEGIFTHDGTTATMLLRDNFQVHGVDLDPPDDQVLAHFGNLLALNDAGDIAFTAGPLTGVSNHTSTGICGGAVSPVIDDDSPGVLIFHAGMVRVLAHPGKRLIPNRVTSVVLGSAAGSQVPVPALAPDGSVVFFVSLNGGSSEAIVGVDAATDYKAYAILQQLGGPLASDSPVGGKFSSALSAPALDAAGGIALLARVTGGSAGEPLVYLPTTGSPSAVVTGDPLPSATEDDGYFAGPPFGAPVLNDRGDVAFRAQVARGSSSVGIFWRPAGGALQALVRTGDPAPLPGSPVFIDLVGDVSINGSGTVAFAGVVDGVGRGVFTVGPNGLQPVAVPGATATGADVTFTNVGLNPSINRDGAVTLHATVEFPDPNPPDPPAGSDPNNPPPTPMLRQEGIYLADDVGIRLLVGVCDPSPEDPEAMFLKLRDPELTGAPSAALRAQVGPDLSTLISGLFLAAPTGLSKIAVVGDDLGGGFTLADLAGTPAVDADGDVAFLATRAQGPRLSPALLRYTSAGIDLLGWRGMPGPLGGALKGFGQPTMNNHRHVAFRGAFQAGTGGKGSYLLATDAGLSSLVQVGENTPYAGQFVSFGSRASVNDDDQLAFAATVTGGQFRNGIFTVSPASLAVQTLSLRLTGVGRDVLRLSAALTPGTGSNGLVPDAERVTVSLADAGGTFWQVAVPKGKLKRRRAQFVPSPPKTLHRQVAAFGIQTSGVGPATVTLRSSPADFTGLGQRSLVPPFTVTVEVGDDSATASVNCTVRGRRVRCL